MKFTGERFLPEVHGNIELEHLHRYLLASKIVLGKDVLDIASGEGYGSAMLARLAHRVTGVDISEEAVAHARNKYIADNLEFSAGSCAAIPLDDASVDVVVSFETIEHHTEHDAMMQEIRRVLRPDGVLVISSPDKLEFNAVFGSTNEFHVKELLREEFDTLLGRYFKNHILYGQKIVYGSAVFREDGHSPVESYELHDASHAAISGVPHAVYQVAVASDGEIPLLSSGVLEQRIADTDFTRFWQNLIAERDADIALLKQREADISRQQNLIAERDADIALLKQREADISRQLELVLASKSWQLTKPLRFVRRVAISRPLQALRRKLSGGSRGLWHKLPISSERKRGFKYFLFSKFPWAFRWSSAYRAWASLTLPGYTAHATVRTSRRFNPAAVANVHVPLLHATPPASTPVRLICFYLPQFHAIPENDAWWGEGFTEWTNVRAGKPQFEGHYQPHEPGELGYYNLLDPEVQRRQVELAKLFGISGFCFYFYWFGGKRLLDAPVENYLKDSSLDLPFCLCWANENWSRRWDGLDSEILIAQQHSPEDDIAFIEHVALYLRDPRYIRIDGKPLLLVYRPSLLPNAKETVARWREWCRKNGVGEIYLTYTQSFEMVDPAKYGFDAATEFPPNNSSPPNITDCVAPTSDEFACTVYDGSVFVERSEHYKQVKYTQFRGVCTSWDNTARRKNRGTVFLDHSPAMYQRWLENAIADTVKNRENTDEGLVFVNAWNEWAEGAHLEPDARYGYAWLQATRNALAAREALVQRLILVVTHDCHPHGAQFLVLEMIRQLIRIGYKPVIVALDGGKLLEDFRALGPLIVGSATSATEMDSFLKTWRNHGYIDALTSTVVCGSILPSLKCHGYRVISLIHELSGVIKAMKQESNARLIAALADKLVFPAAMVREQYEALAPVAPDKVVIRSQGLLRKNPYKGRKPEAHRKVCTRHGLSPDTQIVLNVGYLDERKGPDLFVEIASKVCERNPKVVFIWVGHAETAMEQKVKLRIEQLGLKNKVLLAGFNAEPFEYYASASAYALTSREDPFPNVVLESVAVGVPVVAFESTTGAADFIQEHGGLLARHLDPTDFADHLLELLDNPQGALVDSDFSIQRYLLDLLHALNGMPRVSVVLPNYNYAQLIEKRLASIYAQDYPIYELIILDDASTDDSLKSIEGAISNRPFDARLHVNERNSGSVFRQWEKGVRLASGDLVWIAEADDIADPALLSTLVPAFRNENMVMAFCQSRQIDSNGHVLANDYLAYTGDISDRWKNDHFADGLREIQESLAIKNVIPNVSGVVFDRRALLKTMDSVGEKLFEYRVAGDWLVYLHVLIQGQLYYSAKSLNDHRRHQNSVTSASALEKHLEEVASVQRVAHALAKPDDRVEAQARDYLAHLRVQFKLDSHPA
jgi:glycosyltransferase involved in cell wall biosynthesis/SAM-dependent methyltransferase